jgi:hypothetical protein
MRYLLVALSLLMASAKPASAQVSVGVAIGLPSVEIGIQAPVYPELVVVPGYPVYYDPRADSNYFFYDGVYWVYQRDNWYASTWYNGPWQLVRPEQVPVYVLRVPVRYYRQPPPYFRGWRADAPPRWGQHWGRDWERRHAGWDRWDRRVVPRPAPLPVYQRQYAGDRYPGAVEQQHSIRSEHYRYRPREAAAREHFEGRENRGGPRADPPRHDPGPHDRAPAQRPDRRGDDHDRGGMNRPDGRGNDHDRGRMHPSEPRGGDNDRGHAQGPESRDDGHDRGRGQRSESRDDGRDGRNDDHGRGRR